MKNTGKKQKTIGKMILVASLAAFSSIALRALVPQFAGLDAKGLGQRHAVPLRLDERLHQVLDVGDLRALRETRGGLIPRHTGAHVVDRVL